MNQCAAIENMMPAYLQCKGSCYEDTKNLSVQEVALFIERDLHGYLKKLPDMAPSYAMSLVKASDITEIRIQVTVAYENACEALRRRVEALLWRYNRQTLVQRAGELFPLPPRFRFFVDVVPQCQPLRAAEIENLCHNGASHE